MDEKGVGKRKMQLRGGKRKGEPAKFMEYHNLISFTKLHLYFEYANIFKYTFKTKKRA